MKEKVKELTSPEQLADAYKAMNETGGDI